MIRALAAACLRAAPAAAQEAGIAPGALLRALDKVSGETRDIELAAGAVQVFGRIEIGLAECRFPADDPTSDAFAHVTVHDLTQGRAAFDGWMIASSPALSALDHSRYDVWVIRCTRE